MPQTEPAGVPGAWRRQLRGLPLAPIALLVVGLAIFAAVVLIRRDDGHPATPLPPVGAPAAVSESQLKALAKQTAAPIYWAGPKDGTYELTRTTDGRIYIRYLPGPGKVGDRSATFLTIGTYPAAGAFRSLKRAAARSGGVSVAIASGGLMVFNERTPTSVYIGYPSAKYQVEVFDPSPQQARALVLAGKITPIK
jgi:hypothetical protein